MIDLYDEYYEIACDKCSSGETEIHVSEAPDERALRSVLTRRGWTSLSGEDVCPLCSEQDEPNPESSHGILDVVENWK